MRTLLVVPFVLLLAACPAGSTGPAGPKGDTGPQGPSGPPGPVAIIGADAGTLQLDGGVLVLQGPVGPQGNMGVQGLPGGGYYTSHSDVYCKQATNAPVVGLGAQLQVECDSTNDLGLTGTCYGHNRQDVWLNGSRPLVWSSVGAKAGWLCSWVFNTGVTPMALPDATAEICCIRKP